MLRELFEKFVFFISTTIYSQVLYQSLRYLIHSPDPLFLDKRLKQFLKGAEYFTVYGQNDTGQNYHSSNNTVVSVRLGS